MSDSPQEQAFLAWATEVVKKYQPLLLLQKHDVTVRPLPAGHDGYLESTFRHPYLDAYINYSPKVVENFQKNPASVERELLHELCHNLTDPLYSVACERWVTSREIDEQREALTDHIQRIVWELTHPRPPY